jgi:hypothetical protein
MNADGILLQYASGRPISQIRGFLVGTLQTLNATSRPPVPGAVEPLLTPAELANNTILTGTRCDEVPRPSTCTLRFNSIPRAY